MKPSRSYQSVTPTIILLALGAPMLTACAARSPEQRSYEIADYKIEWLDRYHADKRACRARGGYIVVERRTSCRVRTSKGCQVDIGGHYYCRR